MVHTIQTADGADLILIGYLNQLILKGDTVRQIPEPIPVPLVRAENPRKPPAAPVAELALVGSTKPVVVSVVVRVTGQLHLQVMDHVHPVNTGTVLLV